MAEDILDRLKIKEEEMEALIRGARQRALAIKEEALNRAAKIKEMRAAEAEDEVKRTILAAEESAGKEAARIEEEAAAEALGLKKRGLERMDKAVKEVMRLVIEGF